MGKRPEENYGLTGLPTEVEYLRADRKWLVDRIRELECAYGIDASAKHDDKSTEDRQMTLKHYDFDNDGNRLVGPDGIYVLSSDIYRRLEIIEKLLDDPTLVHPAGCNCAIKSRDIGHHATDCPYRALRQFLADLGSTSDAAEKHG
jgi:hypothetical protein